MTPDPRTLPANPNLTQLKKQAKELARAVRAGDDDATARAQRFHPGFDSDPGSFSLRDAQLTLAREYGFDGWSQLSTEVGNRMVDQRDLHRWFGVQLNNGMWDVIADERFGPNSPLEERERALYSAYASAYHWMNVGSEANHARGEHLISRMAVKIGEGETALRHAERCLQLIAEHPGVMTDWDEPFGHEAKARALASMGRTEEARNHYQLAVELTAAVADADDRSVLEEELQRGPWFGVAEPPGG